MVDNQFGSSAHAQLLFPYKEKVHRKIGGLPYGFDAWCQGLFF